MLQAQEMLALGQPVLALVLRVVHQALRLLAPLLPGLVLLVVLVQVEHLQLALELQAMAADLVKVQPKVA